MPRVSYGAAAGWLAAQAPERVAAICGGASLTRAELDRQSNRLARAYQRLGVAPAGRVTLALPNSLEFLVSCLAIWKLGASPQPISARLPAREREAIVELSQPALIVGVAAGEYPHFASVPVGYVPSADLGDEALPDVVPQQVRTMTSGGSTGRPKLIVDLTPALCDPEVAENCMRPRGIALVPGPLYHAGPFIVAWQCLLSGGTLVVMERFEAEQALALIERHRVDWVLFVPTMMQRIWRLRAEIRNKLRRLVAAARDVHGRTQPAVAEALLDRVARRGEDLRGVRRHGAHRRHRNHWHRVARCTRAPSASRHPGG